MDPDWIQNFARLKGRCLGRQQATQAKVMATSGTPLLRLYTLAVGLSQ